MWENMKYPGDGERREKELVGVGKFWGRLIAMGSKACRHDGTKESALTIIEGLLDKEPVTLHIQEELSRGVALGDTEAGRAVLDELALKAREREAELRELKQQMQESMANSTRESQQMLAQQRAEYDELLRRKENDLQERLRLSEADSEHLRRRLLESERSRSRSRCVVM